MIIYSDGCSLMSGNEHDSWTMNTSTGYEECNSVWSAVLRDKHFPTAKLDSKATTGSSNFSIARRTVHYVNQLLKTHNANEILVCIMWTSIYRKEYLTDKGYFTTLPTDNRLSLKGEATGALMDYSARKKLLEEYKLLDLSDVYYKTLHKQNNFIFDSMVQIEYVNLFLKHNKIKSIQCYGFGDHCTNTDDTFINDIQSRLHEYDIFYIDKLQPQGFYEWANGSHKLGPGLHPLEGAHDMWANLLAKKYLTSIT